MKADKRLLAPEERIAEVLFGLIMVLTFTGSLSVAEAGHEDFRAEVKTMLVGALGCNIAWGIIDGVLYLMGCLAEKAKGLATLRAAREAADPRLAHQAISDALPSPLASVLGEADLEMLRERLSRIPAPQGAARLRKDEWLGAVAVFLWVFVTTFPVAIPFIFMEDLARAMRVSNGIAVGMLFLAGFAYGRCVGRSPWLFGAVMVGLGAVLVALTMALGG